MDRNDTLLLIGFFGLVAIGVAVGVMMIPEPSEDGPTPPVEHDYHKRIYITVKNTGTETAWYKISVTSVFSPSYKRIAPGNSSSSEFLVSWHGLSTTEISCLLIRSPDVGPTTDHRETFKINVNGPDRFTIEY